MTFSRFDVRPRFRIACIPKTAIKVMATMFATLLVSDVVSPSVSSAQIPSTPDEAKVLSIAFPFAGGGANHPIVVGWKTTVQNSPEASGWIRKHQGIGGFYIVSGPKTKQNPSANQEYSFTMDPPETVGWELDKPYSFRLEVENSEESPDHFEGIVHFIIIQGEGGWVIQYVQQGGGEG